MSMSFSGKILCLCGGVGGAKLAFGFSRVLAPEQLTIVINTGDDFEHFGYHISPDIDTVIYNLAGINDKTQGWGIANETWHYMKTMVESGHESWFRIGDKDVLTHRERKELLSRGKSLSDATTIIARHYHVKHSVMPMTDNRVRTMVDTADGQLPFQYYFVREQCRPKVTGFEFSGIDTAVPATNFLLALSDPDLRAVVICPSNPWLSIDPILSLRGIRERLAKLRVPVIAVSPIIAGQAVKGPTAKIMDELQIAKTSLSIAEHYRDILDTLVIDRRDDADSNAVELLGIRCVTTPTLMKSDEDKVALARFILANI